jgi:hypothetical protein
MGMKQRYQEAKTQGRWHSAKEGLGSIRGLLGYIRANQGEFLHNETLRIAAVSDLEIYEKILLEAADKNSGFCLEVG